jgi:predicted Zn-dependent peptidase
MPMSLQSIFGVTREETRLSNGIRLVLFRKPNAPISLEAVFVAGSRFDPADKIGLAHFAEHLLVSGTRDYPTKSAIAEFVANRGGYKNAHVNSDILAIVLEFADKEDMEPFVKLLSDFICDPLLEETTIERERGAIVAELEAKKVRLDRMLNDLVVDLVFQDTSVAHNNLGTADSVNSITKQDIADYYSKYINASNLSITVAGDISMKELQEGFERHLGTLSVGNRPLIKEPLPINRSRHIAVANARGENIRISIDFRTIPRSHADARPLAVLASLLGEGPSSRLKKNLRYEHGLVYTVNSSVGYSPDYGTFSIETSFVKKNLAEIITNICDELRDLKENLVSAEELTTVKNKINKSRMLHMQTSASWVQPHSTRYALYPDNTTTIEDDLEETKAVTTVDLQRVAQKYLTKDNWYLSAVGNITKEDLIGLELDI